MWWWGWSLGKEQYLSIAIDPRFTLLWIGSTLSMAQIEIFEI